MRFQGLGELENDVDGSFLYGFKLLGLCLCKGVAFKYRSYDCNIDGISAILSNGPGGPGPGPGAPSFRGPPNSRCVIFFLIS